MTDTNGSGTGMTVKELILDVRKTLQDYVEKHEKQHALDAERWQRHQDDLQRVRGALLVVGFLAGSGLLLFLLQVAARPSVGA